MRDVLSERTEWPRLHTGLWLEAEVAAGEAVASEIDPPKEQSHGSKLLFS